MTDAQLRALAEQVGVGLDAFERAAPSFVHALRSAVMGISPLVSAYAEWEAENLRQRAMGVSGGSTRAMDEATRPHRYIMRRKLRKAFGE